ncbi:winged helix-turn-helix transcriptional regulator [Candidatus Micrarchaeota archaeon]|nr:winged helix-turn-helix transcriptional regulator [Candidatus Micrarchaeota archaeon]
MAVELDARAFKALSSPTRVELLKKLRHKPRSLTSLAYESKLSVQATDEHLHKLVTAGLVEKDKKSKWAYYQLTPAGASLVRTDRQPVYLMLAVSVMLLLAAAITWNQSFNVPEFKSGNAGALKAVDDLPTITSESRSPAQRANQDSIASANTAATSTSASITNDQTSGANAPMLAVSKAIADSNDTQIKNESAANASATASETEIPSKNAKANAEGIPATSAQANADVAQPVNQNKPDPMPASGIPWPAVFGIGGLVSLALAARWWRNA